VAASGIIPRLLSARPSPKIPQASPWTSTKKVKTTNALSDTEKESQLEMERQKFKEWADHHPERREEKRYWTYPANDLEKPKVTTVRSFSTMNGPFGSSAVLKSPTKPVVKGLPTISITDEMDRQRNERQRFKEWAQHHPERDEVDEKYWDYATPQKGQTGETKITVIPATNVPVNTYTAGMYPSLEKIHTHLVEGQRRKELLEKKLEEAKMEDEIRRHMWE